MEKFESIYYRAVKRKGGERALKALLIPVMSTKQLAKQTDDRCLAVMTKVINQAGFRWSVIDKKWPQFEEAFFNFSIQKLLMLSPDQWEAYLKDTRIVRHGQKVRAVLDNATFLYHEQRHQQCSFAEYLSKWPSDDQIGLMNYLKKHASRLGGNSGQRFLRYIGWDAFFVTQDVVFAMQQAGVDTVDNPTTKRDLSRIQACMNQWHDETQLPYVHLSQIAAFSVGINYEEERMLARTKQTTSLR